MKAYKEYMDRIRLDEEQHDKLLDAVRAAEAEQNKKTAPGPEKIRRFPLKAFGLIASAAAVIILVVGVFPGRQAKQADSITAAAMPKGTEAMALSPEEEVERPVQSGAITENASFTAAFPVTDNEVSEAAAYTLAGVIDFRSIMSDGKKNNGTAAPQATEKTAAENRKTAALKGILDLIEPMLPEMQKTEEQDGTDDSENICRFLIEGKEYVYLAAEGILCAEGMEYALTESEQAELNKLLNEYFADK